MFPTCAGNMLPTKVQENFLQIVFRGLFFTSHAVRRKFSYKSAQHLTNCGHVCKRFVHCVGNFPAKFNNEGHFPTQYLEM